MVGQKEIEKYIRKFGANPEGKKITTEEREIGSV